MAKQCAAHTVGEAGLLWASHLTSLSHDSADRTRDAAPTAPGSREEEVCPGL